MVITHGSYVVTKRTEGRAMVIVYGLAVLVTAAAIYLTPRLLAQRPRLHEDLPPWPVIQPVGLHADPLFRHPRRWWNGSEWTERVRYGMTESSDWPPQPYAWLN
jgi:hypothetical protein